MSDPREPSAPLVVVNARAARLHDSSRRAEIVETVARAVRARTGRVPAIEDGDFAEAGATLAAIADPSLVVAVGGDGTIRQAAAAVAGRGIPLAVVPGGTGNVLAGSLGIGGVGGAIEAIRHGPPTTIDLAEARWGAPATEAPGTVAAGSWSSPAAWASTRGSWLPPSMNGSAACGSVPTWARSCAS